MDTWYSQLKEVSSLKLGLSMRQSEKQRILPARQDSLYQNPIAFAEVKEIPYSAT
jgi:hypothetical protein